MKQESSMIPIAVHLPDGTTEEGSIEYRQSGPVILLSRGGKLKDSRGITFSLLKPFEKNIEFGKLNDSKGDGTEEQNTWQHKSSYCSPTQLISKHVDECKKTNNKRYNPAPVSCHYQRATI